MRFGLTKFIRAAKMPTKSLVIPLAALLLTACLSDKGNLDNQRSLGGGTVGAVSAGDYTVGGTVTGLTGAVVLQNNGGDNLTISASGNFTFPLTVHNGNLYAVSVLTQPAGQTCTVSTGAGTVSADNVTNVTVICSTNAYKLGGTVSGLMAGGSLVLQDNNGDNLTVSANGTFNFATKVAKGSPYSVTVLTQPTGQGCSVANGTGTMGLVAIGNVAVTCTANTYNVGGTVSGLNGSLVLQNNGGGDLAVATNGTYKFATTVAYGNAYAVTVLTQPAGQTCTVSAGSGIVSGGHVTNATVVCSTNSYKVGGSVSGLMAGGSLVLQDNNGDNLTVSANGTFNFATNVAYASPYSVTVLTQPAGQNCSVASGTGTMAQADITNVAITCAANMYTVGGSVSGLSSSVVLQNNAGDNLTVSSNSTFNFATAVAFGNAYAVTVLTQPTGQTCSVATGTGTVAANVTNVSVTCSNNSYTVGGTINGLNGSVVLQNNAGNNLTVSASGSFNFTTPVVYGNSYAVTVLTQPTGQTCFVGSGTGTVPGANVTSVVLNCKNIVPRYAFTANQTDGTVSSFVVDSASGRLKFIGKVAAGINPVSVITDPSGKYVYAANFSNNALPSTLSQYTVGADGVLTPMTPATVAAGAGPRSITVDPTGKYVYLLNQHDATISQYTIAANGALTPMTPATVATGVTPTGITLDPSGKRLYAACFTSSAVYQYTIGANGALVPMTPATVAAGAGSWDIAIDPSGKYAYVANGTANTISQYSVSASGALAAMATTSVPAGGLYPYYVGIDPASKYVYVANHDSLNVSQFTIGATGALTPMATPTVAAGAIPYSITVDQQGKYAYATNFGADTVSQYSIGASGALTPLAPATVANAFGGASMTITAGVAAVQAVPKATYVANNAVTDTILSQYTVGAGGALAAMTPPTVAAGTTPTSVMVDPSGKYAYATNNGSATISQYTVGASGALTPMATPTVATGAQPFNVTVDPSGRYAYSTNAAAATVSQYTIGAGGALIPMAAATVATGTTPNFVVVDPSGKYVYVSNIGVATISQYTIGAGGALTAMATPTVASGTSPVTVAIDPTGQYAYVANMGSNTISQYTIGAGGALAAMATPTVATGLAPVSIVIDASGQYAYAVNMSSGTISQYTIGAGGALTPMVPATVAVPTGLGVYMSIDPSGKYIYVTNTTNTASNNSVTQFTIGVGGALTAGATATSPGRAYGITTTGTWQ
jgi:6-phosphogluconolactonase (cycloisomerase 2 family)